MKTTLRTIAAALCLLPWSLGAQEPEQKWYEVEMIVFTRDTGTVQSDEKWPLDPGHPPLQDTAELLPPTDMILDEEARAKLPPLFEKLGAEMLQLSDIKNKLEASPDYRVVVHTGWLQPVIQNQEGQPVFVDDQGKAYLYQETEGAALDGGQEGTPEEALLRSILAQDGARGVEVPGADPDVGAAQGSRRSVVVPMGPPQHRVYGIAKLTLTRFLHLAVDMVYRAPAEAIAPSEPPAETAEPVFPMAGETLAASEEPVPTVFRRGQAQVLEGFRLNESRRIRSQNLHYFDHPRFGVIAHVLPIEAPLVDGEFQIN